MKQLSLNIYLLLQLFILGGCNDFIEEELENKTVTLLSPVDGSSISTMTVIFWWNELTGADSYRIQVVQPSFGSVQNLIADTLMSEVKFTYSFNMPGTYQWRVKAINNGSETMYSVATFSIDSTLSLTNQQVNLLSPADEFATKETTIQFIWSSLYRAESYRFELLNAVTSSLLLDSLLSVTAITLQLDSGMYHWRVKAENLISSSIYTQRFLYIDHKSPDASIPVSPAYLDTVNNPVTINWNRQGDTVSDSLYIYNDSTMTVPVVSVLISDSSYQFSGINFHHYFWKLKSIDNAGNISSASTVSRFYIIP